MLIIEKGWKHCGKRGNCAFWAISPFVTMFKVLDYYSYIVKEWWKYEPEIQLFTPESLSYCILRLRVFIDKQFCDVLKKCIQSKQS